MTTCSVLYYPGQPKTFCLAGHASFAFQEIVYSFGSGRQTETPLQKKMERVLRGGLPFEQFIFPLSSKQSSYLQEILKSEEGSIWTCCSASGREQWKGRLGEKGVPMLQTTLNNAKLPKGFTCMDFIGNLLREAGIIQIPPIVKISPLLSSLYLRSRWLLGDRRIQNVVSYGSSFSSFRNLALVNCCRINEIAALALPILACVHLWMR